MPSSYKVTILTPTLVGDGQELSPIDYMVWKDHVNVLDQRRIFKLFARGPRLDGYLSQIKRSDRLDFASWGGLAQNYAGRRIAFEDVSLTKQFEKAMTQDLFIRTFRSDANNGIYVPGSAIKGALRTGALFAKLTEEHWNKLREQVSSSERVGRRLAVPLEDRLVEGQLKGLMVGDSASVPLGASTMVYLLRTATLTGAEGKYTLGWKQFRGSTRNSSDATPLFVEMAKPGFEFTGAFNGNPDLLAGARGFAKEILKSQIAWAETAGLDKVGQAAQGLLERAQSMEGGQCCLLPLGWGTGLLGKAAVADASGEPVRQVLRKLPYFARALQTGMPFPKTRRVVFLGGEPATLPGWVIFEITSS